MLQCFRPLTWTNRVCSGIFDSTPCRDKVGTGDGIRPNADYRVLGYRLQSIQVMHACGDRASSVDTRPKTMYSLNHTQIVADLSSDISYSQSFTPNSSHVLVTSICTATASSPPCSKSDIESNESRRRLRETGACILLSPVNDDRGVGCALSHPIQYARRMLSSRRVQLITEKHSAKLSGICPRPS